MTSPMRRALAAGALAVAAWAGAELSHIALLCEPHRTWRSVRSGETTIVVARSERQRRAGDALFVCEVPHRIGPLVAHQDLNCYCAPRELPPDEVARRLGGSCVADAIDGSGGSCGGRYCNGFVDR